MKDRPYKVTLTLAEFRQATKDLPGNTELFVTDGMLDFYEVQFGTSSPLPSTQRYPAAVYLEMGQVWNAERDIDSRLDTAMGVG